MLYFALNSLERGTIPKKNLFSIGTEEKKNHQQSKGVLGVKSRAKVSMLGSVVLRVWVTTQTLCHYFQVVYL